MPRKRTLLRFSPYDCLRESTTYQAILREGREEGLHSLRGLLMKLGTDRFGPPAKRVQAEVRKLDFATAERLISRIMEVESWAELMR